MPVFQRNLEWTEESRVGSSGPAGHFADHAKIFILNRRVDIARLRQAIFFDD
jgi:hypothetical protein